MTELFEYGIHKEDSTHHLHIDVYSNVAFIFPTYAGVDCLPEPVSVSREDEWETNGYYLVKPDWNDYVPTARGIRVPYRDIENCTMVIIPGILASLEDIEYSDTSKKGRLAEHIGQEMFNAGMIPIQMKAEFVQVKNMQMTGIDLHCQPVKIEIKYDKNSLNKGLFLQTHERNPKGWH